MKPLAPNTLLQNRYLVVQLIGKGGMGEVYLAVDQRLGSAVALKRTFFSDDEMLGSAFEREARTLARLRHPVLPKVSDHFTENDTQYLIMEHISGDDLSKRLEISNKPFPLNWVLFWADQLLDALAYLHSHEPPIVHRDIKPQNLKLTDENHIVLLDFGLAKNNTGQSRVTTTGGGSIVGYTPHYAPMEQIRGTGTNPRTDIYSLSATLYQLLTNAVPPDALTRADNVLNNQPDPVQPLNELNAEVPQAVSSVILKGMSLSSEQRWAAAREMQKALREAYSQLQQVMSAQTVAFNMSNEAQNNGGVTGAAQGASLPPSQVNTEQYATPLVSQPAVQNTPPPTNYDSYGASQPQNATPSPASQNHPPPEFDATLKYDAPPFGEKTEVLPNGISTGTGVPEKNFDPAATYPLVNLENQAAQTPVVNNFDSQPQSQPRTENFAVGQASSPPTEVNYSPPPPPARAAPKKKSAGKALAVAGGIGGLGIVALGAAAIGWYALRPSEAIINPTPTPRATVEATPSIEPSPEPTFQADTNTDNSEDIVSSPDANTAATPETTETPAVRTRTEVDRPVVVQKTPAKTAPTPRVVTVATPVVKNTPGKTPPVSGKPAKTPSGGRTDILQ